jgi:hypothetical protein
VARDLIPPPSPAGRPSPDPQPWAHQRTPEPSGAAAAPPPVPPGPAPFRSRFGFVFGALAGIAAAAAAAFVVLLGDSGHKPAPQAPASRWSSWLPPTHDIVGGPSAIANHVQVQYKRDDGKQLVSVHGGPFFYSGGPAVLPFAIKLEPDDGTILDLGSNGVLYTLSGTGKSGRIQGEKPTPARHRLLRREALELALYSFRYVDHIRMVVALLPLGDDGPSAKRAKAASGDPQLQAVFYRPGDLRAQLRSPLATTLAGAGRLKPSSLPAAEAARIDRLTRRHLFAATFQQQPDGQLYLVLARGSKSG